MGVAKCRMTAMRHFKTALKHLVLGALYVTGLLWLLAAARLRRRVVVLTYHRVLPADLRSRSFSAPAIIVKTETFDWQMRFIRKHLKPLTLAQFAEALRSPGPLPSWSCLVTFDDGWHDTLEYALPVLRNNRIPAVLFVATDYVGSGGGFWQERVSAMLHDIGPTPEVRSLLAGVGINASLSAADFGSRDVIRGFVDRIKLRTTYDIEALTRRLEGIAGDLPRENQDRFLDWDGLSELARSGIVDIGSHASSHCPLPRLSLADAERELRESRKILERRIGVKALSIAYPNGDANHAIAELARSEGYEAGFTTERGLVAAGANRLLLNRVNIHEGSSRTRAAFLARLIGLI
jgi:peptidoglycan/xylan/chitin deacetylase (PgdA/CDA1 family)